MAKYEQEGALDYWPRLTPRYFNPQVDAMIAAMREHERARLAAQASEKSAEE